MDYLNIYGFVGKPETAKKTRGDHIFCEQPVSLKAPI
jgi:DNA mismatch repair protein MutL